MKRYLIALSLLTGLLNAENIKTENKIVPQYSEKEKQTLVDQNLKKFAKKKHKALIEIPEEDHYDDYLKNNSEIADPLESFNRVIYTFNGILDLIIFEPLAYMYRDALPGFVQSGVSNFYSNITAPLYAVNHLLQADMDAFFKTTGAFIVNTLFGGLGLVDMAEGMGLKRKESSFDGTLAAWGMESGPYLILPFLGSSCFRGLFGTVGDFAIDPMAMAVENKQRAHNHHLQQKNIYLAVWGIHLVDKRAEIIPFIEDIKKNAIDTYVAVRSAYNQRRIGMEKEIAER